MSYKTISTILTDGQIDWTAYEAAVDLARAWKAHLDVITLGIDRSMPANYYAGANAIVIQQNFAEAQKEAAELEKAVTERLRAEEIPYAVETLTAQLATIAPFVGAETRFSDLVVISKPYGKGRGAEHEAIAESVLFGAGVPLLIVPGELPEAFRRIIVAWNESDEALRAVRAAMPLLVEADLVDVVVIDPPAHSPERSDPGGELSQMLARHGVRAEVSVLARTMPKISEVLQRHAGDTSADMIVMGAYGHSRFREAILGGATRNMLEQADVPVLLAH